VRELTARPWWRDHPTTHGYAVDQQLGTCYARAGPLFDLISKQAAATPNFKKAAKARPCGLTGCARPHQGRWCLGKTPMRTFLDAMPMTQEKMIAA
jgi:hypothetical protein